MNDELENDELEIESTNGSIAKVDAGLVRIAERDNSCEMPPATSGEAKNSINNKDYITILLIPNEKNKENKEEIKEIKEINSEMEL